MGASAPAQVRPRVLFGFGGRCSPILRRKVSNMLRECPPVSRVILSRVLPFPERHVRRRLDNPGPTRLCLFAVSIDIGHGDMDVLGDTVLQRGAIWSSLSTQHHCPFGNRQLGVANHTVARRAKTLRKPECSTEPLNCVTDIFVNQNRDYRRRRGGSIRDHRRSLFRISAAQRSIGGRCQLALRACGSPTRSRQRHFMCGRSCLSRGPGSSGFITTIWAFR